MVPMATARLRAPAQWVALRVKPVSPGMYGAPGASWHRGLVDSSVGPAG